MVRGKPYVAPHGFPSPSPPSTQQQQAVMVQCPSCARGLVLPLARHKEEGRLLQPSSSPNGSLGSGQARLF